MLLFSLFILVLKRARRHWLLTLLSVIGTSVTVGLIASIPIFSDSVGMRILYKELAEYASGNARPPLALRYYRVPSSPNTMTVQEALDMGDWLGAMTRREVGLPIARSYTQIGSHAMMIRTLSEDTRYQKRDLGQVRINCVLEVEEQIEIIEGQPFAAANGADELLIWARPGMLEKLGIQIGERFQLFNRNAVHPDQPTVFRVAGTWRAKDSESSFWYRDPHELLEREFLTTLGAFSKFVAPIMPQQIDYTFWYYVLDENKLRFDDVDLYAKGVRVAEQRVDTRLSNIRVDRSPIEPLREVKRRTAVLERLLFGFTVPVIVLLLAFIGSIAIISVRFQRNEIAILMSRGSSHGQLFILNLMEGVLHMALGVPLGLAMGLVFARGMSLNTGFLTFDRQTALPLATQGIDWRLVSLALLFSLAARLMPTLRASGKTIVTYGRTLARSNSSNSFIRIALALLLCAVSAYAYYRIRQRGTFGLITWQADAEAVNDPLIFFAPSLFIMAAGLVTALLFPLFMHVADAVGQFLGPSLYIGLREVARQTGTYTSVLFLLIFCLGLGAFESSIARSADSWLRDRLRYQVGADYSFKQGTAPPEGFGPTGEDSWLMPVEEYRKIPGVTDATRVGHHTALPLPGDLPSIDLLGIDRLDFARVAYFRRDYTDLPLGELLNRLALKPNAILITPDYLERATLSVGDTLPLDVYVEGAAKRMDFTIVGTIAYFPSMYPADGPIGVANLDFIHDQCGGIQPHSIWLRTEPDTDVDDLKENLKRMGVVAVNGRDYRGMLAEDMRRMERVGIFGNLTVGFLSGSLLAWLGLLLYTTASLVSRVRRFTILRAIGFMTRQILATLSTEYLCVIAYGLLAGAATGVAASRLFVPYFQFTDDPSLQVPPFVPYIDWERLAWIAVVYLAVLTLSEIIVLASATRREAFQVLRMGNE
ncbi:MAG: FtsX-like permease family protein [Chloroflexota bacterium]|nr:FtsX-like permease family protein [Chloroflexota bacterium]